MAEGSRKNQDVSSEVGIPSGLNRIRTRQVSSKDHLSSKPDELTASWGHGASRPPLKQKQKQDTVAQRQGETIGTAKEERKGKKIARWFTSYISKYSGQSLNNVHPNTEDGDSKIKTPDERECRTTKQSSANSVYGSNVLKGLKSFSHELGPRGGIQPAYPRPHSYSDLKELLSSFSARFDAAKEIVNTELAGFAEDIVDIIDKIDSPFPEEKRMAEDLLLLAQNCVEMTSSQFRAKCETIVQDLTEKRQQCQTGLVKWLFTWMLFILTRCTRLLIFQKENEPMDEKSLNKFKKCLDSIPAVEMSWVPTPGVSDSSSGLSLYQRFDAQQKLQGIIMPSSLPEASWCSSIQPADQSDLTSKKDSFVLEKKFPSQKSQFGFLSEGKQFHLGDGSYEGKSLNDSGHDSLIKQQHSLDGSFNEQEQTLDGSDSVICRICEEAVPVSHLESHSYICAYAEKCELSCVDVDERLLKLEEILEQIIESRNLSSYPPVGSPEPRIQTTNSGIASEGYSPKVNEWRNKGVEGMFEEIHEMDTACIDEFYPNPINLKNYLSIKLYNCGAPSSTGSMTSVSSTNTPRTSHFDSFWLEHNNPSEQEDVHEMIDLADIARCVAGTDISKEGSYEYLLACMQDLQDVLKRSKLKALVIDTFGGRIEKLLREKYILACEAIDVKSPKSYSKCNESTRLLLDSASQSGMTLSPSQMLHKDRTSIDDFEIIKPISRGAFGKVFLARKRTTGDLFAIKVLKKLDMIRKNDIERILAERNILITVRNPFVVRFFYSFTCRDNLYLVMEYLNGGDLYSLLRKVGCLEEDVARIYIAELVLALEYLHSLGIVHRDLKPDNILIAHDGHIKLTDFGLSKIGLINNTINLSGPETELTRASNVHNLHAQQTEDTSWHSAVGTPDYLAPEILLGTEHGYAADWWSVGIILFELITGIPPFSAERSEVIFDNILNKKIPWPNIPGDMSYEAQDLINRFLIHDPNQRLGASGSAEVKSDPFFRGVNWDSLALQKAAFVPQPDSIDDTSYFVSRFSRISSGMPDEEHCSKSCTDSCHSCSNSGDEIDECGDLAEFDSSSLNLSLINFSFKNLSQLASINHDVLLQTGKDPAKGSPSKNMGT